MRNALRASGRSSGAACGTRRQFAGAGRTAGGGEPAAGTINYTTGAVSLTFGKAPANLAQIWASYQQQIVTAGAGKALAIKTAGANDGAAVASKSFAIHQDAPDHHQGTLPASQFTVSGWYKASAAISAGIRMRVVFGLTEDFAVGAAIASTDVIVNGAATGFWTQASVTVTAPTTAVGEGQNFWARVVVYHNPDGIGGVTVEWDDIAVKGIAGVFSGTYGIRNPSFDFAGAITSNPASHYRDALQGTAIKLPLADARLDLTALKSWWQDANTNSRNNNMIVDSQGTVFDSLRAIAAIGRASFGMRDGLYSIVRDQTQTVPVQHFTPRNSWGFKSTRVFPNLPGALKVRFINPNANWVQDGIVAYDDGFNPSNTAIYEALDLTHGVTAAAQAWRDGRFHLAQARLRPETYELTVDIENIVCQRGDLVLVSHDVPQWGGSGAGGPAGPVAGRIKGVALDAGGNAIAISTDEQFTFEPGSSYVIRVRRTADGTSLLINLVNPAGAAAVSTNGLTFASSIPAGSPQPAAGDLMMFGIQGSETVQLLVTKIKPGPDLTATLELVDYASAVYTADSGTPPVFAGATPFTPTPAPVITTARSDDPALTKGADGSVHPRIAIALDDIQLQMLSQPPRSSGVAQASLPVIPTILGVRVQHRRSPTGNGTTNGAAAWSSSTAYVVGDTVTYNGFTWLCWQANTNQMPGNLDGSGNPYWTVLVTTVAQPTPGWHQMALQTLAPLIYAEPVAPGFAYDVRMRYEMSDGSVTAWTTLASHTIAGQTTLPADVTAMTATQLGVSRVLLSWTASTSPNIREYEIRQSASWAAGTLVAKTRHTQLRIEALAAASYTYWVGAVDTSGNYSAAPPFASLTVGAGGFPVMEVFDRIVGTVSGPAADVANTAVETTLYDKIVPDNTLHPDGALVIDWIADPEQHGRSLRAGRELLLRRHPDCELSRRRRPSRRAALCDVG